MTESISMTDSNSLTAVYHKLLAGDEEAANKLWQACSLILLSHARKHLQGVPQKMADAEDIVQEAFASFIKAAQMGRFPDFKDRDDLWRLLFTITKRKAIDLRRKESRRKVSGESVFQSPDNEKAGIQDIPADLSEEEVGRLLSESMEEALKLLNAEQCQYALAKLEGYTNREIAEKFGVALRSVERKLHLIRRLWWDHQQRDAD
jgi:RNA polymerase sigma factor (sigma-70 family)